jgi:hypothetical protein
LASSDKSDYLHPPPREGKTPGGLMNDDGDVNDDQERGVHI